MLRFVLLLVALTQFGAATADAQSSTPARSPNDSIFRRARKLVSEGNGPAGRALVDSLLSREQEGRTGYGDALYWRGALAATAADAERDYRRVIVEYPLSAYADDALLSMAELEQARGDRAAALQHLQRFVREHPASSDRGTAAFAGARLAFELGDTRAACGLIADARASVPTGEVELRNQIDYYASRCPSGGAAAAPAAVLPSPPTTTRATRPPADSAHGVASAPTTAPTRQPRVSVPMTPPAKVVTAAVPPQPETRAVTPAASSTSTPLTSPTASSKPSRKPPLMFTVQLAAFNTLEDANTFIQKLEKTGIHARVTGAAKPFRVRLALHPTRQAAVAEAAELKSKSIVGFVTTEEPPPEQKSP